MTFKVRKDIRISCAGHAGLQSRHLFFIIARVSPCKLLYAPICLKESLRLDIFMQAHKLLAIYTRTVGVVA